MKKLCEAKQLVQEHVEAPAPRDVVYLVACYLHWCRRHDLFAYSQLVAALDDEDEDVRLVAGVLVQRSSPRPPLDGGSEENEW